MDYGKKFIAIVDEPCEETNDKRHRNAPTERGVPVSVYMVEEQDIIYVEVIRLIWNKSTNQPKNIWGKFTFT